MNVLVINCGSSSLKFQLIDAESENLIAKGLCERIGIEGSKLVYSPTGGEEIVIQEDMPDHTKAVQMVLDALTNSEYGVVKSLDEINAVGHRLVHGGEKFACSTIITDEVISPTCFENFFNFILARFVTCKNYWNRNLSDFCHL